MNIDVLRNQINEIDREILNCFIKRLDVAKQIAEYKVQNNVGILNIAREHEVIKNAIEFVNDAELSSEVEMLMNFLMNISRSVQAGVMEKKCLESVSKDDNNFSNESNVKIGYQGLPGSNSHVASLDYFGENMEFESYSRFCDVFEAIKTKKIKYGVLPIENSYTGSIHEVYDLLSEYGYKIQGEYIMDIDHNILGIKGSSISDIRRLYSHPQGFLQSDKYLRNYPDIEKIPYLNTATSADHVRSQNDISNGAIASKKAADIYGLDILANDINDNKNNRTKFVIVSDDYGPVKDANKITVMFNVNHEPGSLYKVLSNLAYNDINMQKIESRPTRDKNWEYKFYIDILGEISNIKIDYVLKLIKEEVREFNLLGYYKSYK